MLSAKIDNYRKTDILKPSEDMLLEQDKVIMAGDINVSCLLYTSGIFLVIAGSVMGVVGSLGKLFLSAKNAIGLVKTATLGMNTAFLASPITWVIVGIVALVAAFVVLWNKSEAVSYTHLLIIHPTGLHHAGLPVSSGKRMKAMSEHRWNSLRRWRRRTPTSFHRCRQESLL